MVHLAVGQSEELQAELVDLFCKYDDVDAAVTWALKYALPSDRLPLHVVQVLETRKSELER
jgi:hypothetical protein